MCLLRSHQAGAQVQVVQNKCSFSLPGPGTTFMLSVLIQVRMGAWKMADERSSPTEICLTCITKDQYQVAKCQPKSKILRRQISASDLGERLNGED
jgi:hypothetical protein